MVNDVERVSDVRCTTKNDQLDDERAEQHGAVRKTVI
jgi:hypothetical protein